MRALAAVALVALGVVALSCGDSNSSTTGPDPDPVAGWLKVRLTTSNADDGGVMFLLSGAQIDSVRSTYPELYTERFTTSTVRVIVAGNLTNGGVVAEVLVPDVESATNYSAAVEQVAARGTYEQRPASSASLSLEK
jgi:hypothetical protein